MWSWAAPCYFWWGAPVPVKITTMNPSLYEPPWLRLKFPSIPLCHPLHLLAYRGRERRRKGLADTADGIKMAIQHLEEDNGSTRKSIPTGRSCQEPRGACLVRVLVTKRWSSSSEEQYAFTHCAESGTHITAFVHDVFAQKNSPEGLWLKAPLLSTLRASPFIPNLQKPHKVSWQK